MRQSIVAVALAGVVAMTGCVGSGGGGAPATGRSGGGPMAAGGPIGFNVRTASGFIGASSIVWTGDANEIVVVNLTQKASADVIGELYRTLRMQLFRATSVELREAEPARGCCPRLTGSGNGHAGNTRAQIEIDQRLDGADRVRQTVTIKGYRGGRFDDSTARLLFQ